MKNGPSSSQIMGGNTMTIGRAYVLTGCLYPNHLNHERHFGNDNNCLYNMKYLPLYYKFAATGVMENHPESRYNGGLCGALPPETIREFAELFKPESYHHVYWAHPGKYPSGKKMEDIAVYGFTPLRQNIVLLLAAMNGEL